MRRTYHRETVCAVCGKVTKHEYDRQRDIREFPNPYYCPEHNPERLHRNNLIEFCDSLLGKYFFDLSGFRKYALYTDGINIIDYYTANYKKSTGGVLELANESICVYYQAWQSGYVWQSPEAFRKAVVALGNAREEIISICVNEINKMYGYNQFDRISGYNRIMKEVKECNSFMVL